MKVGRDSVVTAAADAGSRSGPRIEPPRRWRLSWTADSTEPREAAQLKDYLEKKEFIPRDYGEYQCGTGWVANRGLGRPSSRACRVSHAGNFCPIRTKSGVAPDRGLIGRRDRGALFRRPHGLMLGDEVGSRNVGPRERGGAAP